MDDVIYDQQTIVHDSIDFNEEVYSGTSEKEDGTCPSELYKALSSDYSSDPGYVDLDPDKSGCRNSPARWNDEEQLCASTSYFSGDVLNQASTILSLDTDLDPGQVTWTSGDVMYRDDESLFSFNGDRSPNTESFPNIEIASADMAPFLDDLIFEAETSELQSLGYSRLAPMCSSPPVDARTAASLCESSSQDNFSSDEDLMKDAVSDFRDDIPAETCCGFDFTHDISGFDFTAIDDFGHEAARPSSVGNGCVSGVKEFCFPRGVESTVGSSLSGLHALLHDSDELQCSNDDALDGCRRDVDFVAMDFGL